MKKLKTIVEKILKKMIKIIIKKVKTAEIRT